MFYPASDALLAKYPSKDELIRELDGFLHEHGGEVIYVREAAFTLDMTPQSVARWFGLYQHQSLLTEVERAKCVRCEEIVERCEHSDEPTWFCDHCGEMLTERAAKRVECYRVVPSLKPKINKREEKEMAVQERITQGRIRPWSLIPEAEYLRTFTHFGAVEEEWVLDRLQVQGFCLLRAQAQTPTPLQLQAIEDFLGPALNCQNGKVGKIKSISPEEGIAANTGDSVLALPFHTDGTQEDPLPPAILSFQYETGPTFGGQSTFLDLASVLLGLTETELESLLVGLAYPDAAVCEKKQLRYEGPLVKPVYADQSLSFRLRFDDVIKVAARSEPAFAQLREKIFAQKNFLKYKPYEGDIAIFDNWRVLHGRTSVQGGRHLRFHNRMWIRDLEDRHKGRCLLGVRGISSELILKVKQTNNGR